MIFAVIMQTAAAAKEGERKRGAAGHGPPRHAFSLREGVAKLIKRYFAQGFEISVFVKAAIAVYRCREYG